LKKDLDVSSQLVLTGSFHRDTKTRPLKDVDFFCPMLNTDENRKKYRDAAPKVILDDFEASLRKRYGDRVNQGRRSVRIQFGGEDTRILSYDVVPAFEHDDDVFEIPDKELDEWIKSDPTVHSKLASGGAMLV
jgi:hypothetical protein